MQRFTSFRHIPTMLLSQYSKRCAASQTGTAASRTPEETAAKSEVGGKNADAANGRQEEEKQQQRPWENPYQHVGQETQTYSDFREAAVDWEYVKRLLPKRIISAVPANATPVGTVTPSGWRAPGESTSADLPYYIRRGTNAMPEIYLERRRDELNPKTMDFEYVELVVLRGIFGDIFACEQDLRRYVEQRVGHPVATHVDELKGLIKIKGADRTLIEQFVYDSQTEFTLDSHGMGEGRI